MHIYGNQKDSTGDPITGQQRRRRYKEQTFGHSREGKGDDLRE